MIAVKYIIYKECKYYVVQCLDIEISTFGESSDNALSNLDEALTLYFEERRF